MGGGHETSIFTFLQVSNYLSLSIISILSTDIIVAGVMQAEALVAQRITALQDTWA